MEERCLGQIEETDVVEEGETSQVQLVAEVICPGQCSGHGTCNQGTCQCDQGKNSLFVHTLVILF